MDSTECLVERSRNFARQGEHILCYFKRLIAVTPNGGACSISDLFEGEMDEYSNTVVIKVMRKKELINKLKKCLSNKCSLLVPK